MSETRIVAAIASHDKKLINVFKYNKAENLWHQYGSDIMSETSYFGWQLSLSSEGSTLAGACYDRDGIRVFHFNTEANDWEQKGQVITTNRGYFFDMALLSSESFLAVTYDNIIQTFIYDETNKLWIESLVPVPEINYSKDYPCISISADCTSISWSISA